MVGLAQAYEDMGRTFFDDKLFKWVCAVGVMRVCRTGWLFALLVLAPLLHP